MRSSESRLRRRLRIVAYGVAALAAWSFFPSPAVAANLVGIVIAPTSRDLRVGDTLSVRALATYDDGTYGVDVSAQVAWGSTVPGVASVSDGLVTAAAAGATRVVAIDTTTGIESDATSGNLRVVQNLTSISLTPEERILPVRRRTRYRAWGDFEDDVVLNLVGDALFSISDPSIASISETGLARGLSPGQATISAVDQITGLSTTDFGRNVVLTVVGDLRELSLAPERLALSVGDETDLEARGLFDGNCKWLDFGSRLRWSTTDDDVVSVSRDGEIQCRQEGTALVSIRDRHVSSAETERDAEVVCGGQVVAIEVSPASFVVPIGTRRGLEATYVFADGTRADGTRSVVWSSTDSSVFEITKATGRDEGEGRALATGTATVIATDPVRGISSDDPGGSNGRIDVPGALLSLEVGILPTGLGPVRGEPGTSVRINAVAVFEDGLLRAVKKLAAWSSSDPSVAAIPDGSECPETGQIDLISEGMATISITYPKAGGPGSITREVDVIVEFPGSSTSRAFLAPSEGLL